MRKDLLLNYCWLGTFLLTLLGLFFLIWPYAVSAYYLERGTHWLDSGVLNQAISDLVIASNFESKNSLASRRLAQAYLQIDRPDQALGKAQQAIAWIPGNPLTHLELGDVYDRLGEIEHTIAQYEAGRVGDRRPQLIANYLQLAERLWNKDDQAQAASIWQKKVDRLDPGNLYANWRLAQYYANDLEAAAPYQDKVRCFPLNSIAASPDRRIDEYQVRAFLGAVADGLWSRETLLNVIAYRVWQDQSQATKNLLQALLVELPTDADLHFYLGEMYHRRGDGKQAEIAYRHVLDIDQRYAQAYLRLGMVAESSCESRVASCVELEKAGGWYEQYHQLVPDDPIGLRKLIEIYQILGKSEAANLRAELETKIDERRLVAEALKIGLDEFHLGEDLLPKMKFKNGQLLSNEPWQGGVWLGSSSDGALFFAGPDSLEREGAARTITLWQRPVPEGTGLPYTDYGQNITLEANAFYILSFDYKTNEFKAGSAFVALLEFVLQPRLIFTHTDLPDTDGRWQRRIVVGRSYQEPLEVRLILRNWGLGDVLFDQVELRPINLDPTKAGRK